MTHIYTLRVKKRNVKINCVYCIWYKFEKMKKNKVHFRHVMLYYYCKGKNVIQIRKKICAIYNKKNVNDRLCQFWPAKFHTGNFSVENAPRSRRPTKIDEDQIKTLENNSLQTIREIGKYLIYQIER